MAGSFLRQATASQARATHPFIDDTDFKTAETGLTIANTDVKIIVNGGASADKNSGGGTHRANGVYGLTFDATDTATVGEMEVSIVVSGALPVFMKFWVLEEAVYDALFAASAPGYLQPTTAGRTLDVSAGGEAGIDWANVGSPTTTVGLSGTTVKTATDVETDTADIQSRIPAALVGGRIDANMGAISADATAADNLESAYDGVGYAHTGNTYPWTAAWDAEVQSEVDDALIAKGLDHLVFASVAGTDIADNSIIAKLVSKSATADWDSYVNTTDALEALRDRGDAAWITATGFSTHSAADVWAVGTRTLTAGTNINGSTFTAIPWNASWDAEVQSEVDDALVAQNLDHLVKSAVDTNFATTVHLDSVIGQLADAGGTATFDRTTDALEVLGAATAPSAASIADAVWDEALAGHLSAGSTGEALNAAGSAGDPWTTSLPGSYTGSQAGKMLSDILTDTGTTLQGELDGIQADTEDIQSRLPAALVSGRMDSDVGAMQAAVITSSVLGTNCIGASELAADAVAEIADAVWDEATSGHATSGTFGQMFYLVRANTAQAGGAMLITLDASASATDDIYNYCFIVITGGTGAGQCRQITDYVGSTKVATVATWQTNPSSDSVFVILPSGQSNVNLTHWVGSAPNALTAGLVNVDVHAYGGSTGTASAGIPSVNVFRWMGAEPDALSSGEVIATVNTMNTDVLTSTALAASAVTEIQSGLATSASISALNNLSAAQVNAEVLDVLNVDTFAEVGQESPAATTTIRKMVAYLYKAFRNKKTQSATEFKLYADDGTTVDQKSTTSDDGSTFTSGEIGAGP